jgi:hypothetical protein
MFLLLLILVVAAVVGVALRRAYPPRAVGPANPPRIDFFEVHPRHICRGDTLTATWTGDADTGNLAAAALDFLASPFLEMPLNPFPANGLSLILADISAVAIGIELVARRPGHSSVARQVEVRQHGGPNDWYRFDLQLSQVDDPAPGWSGRRYFSDDAGVNPDDWSPRIRVDGLRYADAGGREMTITWVGLELATFSPSHRDHSDLEGVTVVGDWVIFVRARPGEDRRGAPIGVSLDLHLHCV